MRFFNKVCIVCSLVVASLALTWTCYGEKQKMPNQQNYERLKHKDLGVEMNERLERSLNDCLKAQEEVRAITASPETKITKDAHGFWFILKRTKTTDNEVIIRINFWSEAGRPRTASKNFYSVNSDGTNWKQVPESPGYNLYYDEKGNVIRFKKRPSDGIILKFHSNGKLESFYVRLTEKKYFKTEWNSEGRLVKEQARKYYRLLPSKNK